MKKVFIERMFFAILAVTVVLTMSSAPDKKAKAGNIICPTCGAEGYGSHPTTSATCTEPAYEILYYGCNVHTCFKRAIPGSSALGHDYSVYLAAATCQHPAVYGCTRCKTTTYSGSVSGHSWVKTADATCTSAATYKCSDCGTTKTEGSALGHSWWVTGATCQKGQINTCSRCGTTQEVGYPKDHDYSSNPTVVQSQSCIQPEITRYYCIYGCGNYQDKQTKSAKGHNYYVSAGATVEHGTEHTCSACGNKYYDNDKITVFTLSFDALTNGGTTSERSTQVSVNTIFNLTGKTASKAGWEFVGWNTDRTAKTGLSSVTMNGDKTVYAIFKKDLTANFIDG